MSSTARRMFRGFIRRKKVSPESFPRVFERQRGNIKSYHIVPPNLGSDDFGSIELYFKVPVNDSELCQAK